MDFRRREHFNFNYKTAEQALEVCKDVMDAMSKWQLSKRIAEIHDMPTAYKNFVDKAAKKGFTAATYSYNQLYHMPTSYKID